MIIRGLEKFPSLDFNSDVSGEGLGELRAELWLPLNCGGCVTISAGVLWGTKGVQL